MPKLVIGACLLLACACSARHASPGREASSAVVDPPFSTEEMFTKPSRRKCRAVEFRVGRARTRGSLVRCHGGTVDRESLDVSDWEILGPEDLSPASYEPVAAGEAIEIWFGERPNAPVRLRAYEALASAGLDSSRIVKEVELPADRRMIWSPELPPGRYLISAWAHWTNICTERFVGVEVRESELDESGH